MKAWLLRVGDHLRESYWFVPSLMAAAAILLACVMIYVDSLQGQAWMDGIAWLYAARPEGARQLLSAIGGSMITVAGTVFSVTIAAVVYASGQYGPRLLSNFMSDRGNQVTLGTFIATFLYCLIVLRTIRAPGEGGDVAPGFVPQLAVLVGLGLVLCSIGVLIFFIHHVPMRIHINNVIDRIGTRLIEDVGERFPTFLGDGAKSDDSEVPCQPGEGKAARATGTGYIQFIDDEELMEIAAEKDLVIRVHHQPGDFTHAGRPLAFVQGDECDGTLLRRVAACFAIGARRTALQDMRLLIDELVEIAARALSPGVNDPFTGATCNDWLAAAIGEVACRELPSPLRKDDDGKVRIITHPVTFEGFMRRSFGALQQYAAADKIAAMRFISGLGEVALSCEAPARIRVIASQLDAFTQLAAGKLQEADLAPVTERASSLREALGNPRRLRQLREGATWLGGTA